MSQEATKTNLRRHFRERLRNRTELQNDQASQQISDRLRSLADSHPGLWGSYTPLRGEPNLNWSTDLCFPRVSGDQLIYSTPQGDVSPRQIAGVLVPGLAFDRMGVRLGRGGGYFDRFLSDFAGLKVGVCFQEQLVDSLPRDSWDVQMDVVITESESVWNS